MQRIAVGVDGSECALRAVDFAAKLALDTGAELVIVAVIEPNHVMNEDLMEYARVENVADRWGDLSETLAREILSVARGRAAVHEGIRTRVEWRNGSAAEQLSRFALKNEVDVLVVGHTGRSRIAGVMFGSVPFKLLGIAPCPLAVVR